MARKVKKGKKIMKKIMIIGSSNVRNGNNYFRSRRGQQMQQQLST